MKSLHVGVFLLAAVLAFPAFAQAPTDMQILVQKIKADKKLVVANNMQLSEAEAKGFWPVYDSYQKDLEGVNQRLVIAIGAFAEASLRGSVPNDVAKQILDESIAIDEEEVRIKRAVVAKLNKVVPDAKIARYIQIENKIRALVRVELAEKIPLIK
jgi:hypothetical protein